MRSRWRSAVLGAALLSSSLAFLPARTARAADPASSDPWWGTDKALHFGASAAIAGGSYAVSTQIWNDIAPRVAFSAGIALGVGVVKELLDAAGLGDPSLKDLVWDVAGTAVGVGICVSIDAATR